MKQFHYSIQNISQNISSQTLFVSHSWYLDSTACVSIQRIDVSVVWVYYKLAE